MSRYFKKIKAYAFRSLVFVLAAALAVTASCFSSGLVAQAGYTYTEVGTSVPGVSVYFSNSFTEIQPRSFSADNASGDPSNYLEWLFPLDVAFHPLVGSGTYLNGYVSVNVSFDVDFRGLGVSNPTYYFDTPSFSGNGLSFSFVPLSATSGIVTVLFDNYRSDGSYVSVPNWRFRVVGHLRAAGYLNATLNVSSRSGSVVTGSSPSSGTTSDIIASGINSASSVQDAIHLLQSVSSNTALLSDVLTKIDNLNGLLANIYSEVQAGNQSLSTLISALSGVDVSGMQLSAIQAAMYNNWVRIIRDSINKDAPDVSGVGDKQQSANDQLTSNDQLESQAFGFADNNISAIDFNVAFPGTVASSAVVVMSWLSLIWEKLGNLQFLVSATCLAGLLTIVLGVINKFVRSSKRD